MTTIDGWLFCIGVKAGYWNREDFLTWLSTKLLPCIREQFGDKPIVVIMDNLGLYVDDSITEAIEHAGYIVYYLPPYSPDFNPIEMSFHVLKSWIRRYFWQKRAAYRSFGDFLKMAIERSDCGHDASVGRSGG